MNDWFDPKTWLNPGKAAGAFNDMWKSMMWLPTTGGGGGDEVNAREIKSLLETHHKAISGMFENLALLNENNAKMLGDLKRVLAIVSDLDGKIAMLNARIDKLEPHVAPKKDPRSEGVKQIKKAKGSKGKT